MMQSLVAPAQSVGLLDNITADYICNNFDYGNAVGYGTAAGKGWAL